MYTFIFNQYLLKINFSSVNSPGWTDDSHVLVGMGWISNSVWFVAQSRVEQLCLERLDMLHLSAHCILVPSMTGFLCQQTEPWGSLHCGRTYTKPALDVFSALSGINTCFSRQIDMVQQCWVTAQVSLRNANPSQPWGRQLKVRGLGFWSVPCLVVAGTSDVHDPCYRTCVLPEAGYT